MLSNFVPVILSAVLLASIQACDSQSGKPGNATTPTTIETTPITHQPVSETVATIDRISKRIKPEVLEFLKNPTEVFSMAVVPDYQSKIGYKEAGPSKPLTAAQVKELQTLLLDDSHYILDMTKSCVFSPTTLLIFARNGEEVRVLSSPSCKQIKIMYKDQKSVFLDNDPIHDQLESFKEATKRS